MSTYRLNTTNPWMMMLFGVIAFGGSIVGFLILYFAFAPLEWQERIEPYFFLLSLGIAVPAIWIMKKAFRLAGSKTQFDIEEDGLRKVSKHNLSFLPISKSFTPWTSIQKLTEFTDGNGTVLSILLNNGKRLKIVYSNLEESEQSFDAFYTALKDKIEANSVSNGEVQPIVTNFYATRRARIFGYIIGIMLLALLAMFYLLKRDGSDINVWRLVWFVPVCLLFLYRVFVSRK